MSGLLLVAGVCIIEGEMLFVASYPVPVMPVGIAVVVAVGLDAAVVPSGFMVVSPSHLVMDDGLVVISDSVLLTAIELRTVLTVSDAVVIPGSVDLPVTTVVANDISVLTSCSVIE